MLKGFLKEEKGQGAIEYILLAGGIIVAAVVIFAIYSKMTGEAANRLNETTGAATSTMSSKISAEVGGMV
ncbi:MAG: class III signal peptide-containing protein [Methanobacteriota archaeon]|nr:MAG: class III signal peptide-containing protein [Euryarchaeota archaeon]